MSNVIHPIELTSITMIALLCFILNIKILNKQHKKRKSCDSKFTTKSLELFSLLSVLFAALYNMDNIVRYFPISCKFSNPLSISLIACQFYFIGLYQLSRLHYCFSQTQVYSNKGYPNWLFTIMYTVGTLWLINCWIFPYVFAPWKLMCGINSKFQYFPKKSLLTENSLASIWTNISSLCYFIWDCITLLLYIVKVYTFRNKYKSEQIQVYKRIMCILSRIVILTLGYEIPLIWCTIAEIIRKMTINEDTLVFMRIVRASSYLLSSVIASYSIFLMQQHNSEEYKQFLKVVHFVKCDVVCCCCCKAIIRYELGIEQNQTESIASCHDQISLLECNELGNNIVPRIHTHSSANQGTSKDVSGKINYSKTGSTPIGKPSLKHSQISEFGDSSTDTFAGIQVIMQTDD
eukprot:475608_1